MKFLRKIFSFLFVLPFAFAFPACKSADPLNAGFSDDDGVLPSGETAILPELPERTSPSDSVSVPETVPETITVPAPEQDPPVPDPVPTVTTTVEPKETFTSGTYVECTGDKVCIRAGATTSSSVLGYAEKGTNYALLEKNGSWNKIYYRGQTAYLYGTYCKKFTLPVSENAKTESVLTEGYKLLGTPYVYGAVRYHDGRGNRLSGFTTNKFDCSSLTQYAFYKGANVLLGTTTRAQVKQGKFVEKKDLKRGDCIYFTNASRVNNTGVERIGHVAIWLGDGYILHTSSDYARIEKMTTARWNYYVESRRFL